MMRFGSHDHPVLLEALGDLLAPADVLAGDAKRLAARCYLRAAGACEVATEQRAYRALAERALRMQTAGSGGDQIALQVIEARLQAERRKAERYIASVHQQEHRWIEAGEPVDALFQATYLSDAHESALVPTDSETGLGSYERPVPFMTATIFIGGGLLSIVIFLVFRHRHRHQAHQHRRRRT